jgi:hypothetical protein
MIVCGPSSLWQANYTSYIPKSSVNGASLLVYWAHFSGTNTCYTERIKEDNSLSAGAIAGTLITFDKLNFLYLFSFHALAHVGILMYDECMNDCRYRNSMLICVWIGCIYDISMVDT